MAYLRRPESKRGQIIIVSAFALGVLFVALALILNSAIFTENLASRGETTGGEQVINYRDTLDRGVGEIMTAENENVSMGDNPSHSTLESRVQTGLDNLSDFLIQTNARSGATSSAAISGRTNGTFIRQNDSDDFLNATDDENWTPALGVNQTRAFRFNVTDPNCGDRFSDCFVLNVTNGSSEWKLSVNDSSGLTVAVDNGSGSPVSCDPVTEPAIVDVSAGTVGGKSCSALNFSDVPNTEYDIIYRNGADIKGTYSLVVDNSSIATGSLPEDYNSTLSPNPSATQALYALDIEYDYQTAQLNYSSSVRVAPGEPDE